MAHNHSHQHGGSTKNLKIAFFINIGFTCLEIVGGFFTNSIAIISDALHDLGDSLSLGLAWYLENKASQKGSTNRFSFGYARFRLLGALVNALVLIVGSIYIIIEAIGRLQNPEPVKSDWMIVLAVIGVAANGYAAWRTKGSTSLNEKVVSWHLLEDVLGWVAVLIVSIILQFKDWYFLDPCPFHRRYTLYPLRCRPEIVGHGLLTPARSSGRSGYGRSKIEATECRACPIHPPHARLVS